MLAPSFPLTILGLLDQARRTAGQLLDDAGVGPDPTPARILTHAPGMLLRHFVGGSSDGPAVLLVPAPIKRWYIWDLHPDSSVVARLLRHGLQVFLVEWTDPGPDQQDFGLDDYADRMLMHCVEEITRHTGQRRVPLVAHSLGGTLATIFAIRHPDRVAGLLLIEAPSHFGADAGAFAPVVAISPHAGWLRSPERAVPGSLLDIVSAMAAPESFQLARYGDLMVSLADPELLHNHMRVQRWSLDEFALPGQLFEDVVERLYRRDELMSGALVISGQRIGPTRLTAPIMNVINPRSRVIPPESILPFHHAAASPSKQVLHYHGDIAVAIQHVGALVGRSAHRDLWPALIRWLQEFTITA
jgi:polyhydroxyalkanoate synthase